MFNSVKKVNISAANIRTNFELSKYFCGNVTSFLICHGDRYLAYFKNY